MRCALLWICIGQLLCAADVAHADSVTRRCGWQSSIMIANNARALSYGHFAQSCGRGVLVRARTHGARLMRRGSLVRGWRIADSCVGCGLVFSG